MVYSKDHRLGSFSALMAGLSITPPSAQLFNYVTVFTNLCPNVYTNTLCKDFINQDALVPLLCRCLYYTDAMVRVIK